MHLNPKYRIQSDCPQLLNLPNHRHPLIYDSASALYNLPKSDFFFHNSNFLHFVCLEIFYRSLILITHCLDPLIHPLFGPFDSLLPLRSTLRALLDESPISRLRILFLRTTSRISLNFSLLDPRELLLPATTVSHDSSKDDIKIYALISSLKLISTELNWLTIILNSFIWLETDSPSDICRLSNLCIEYTLFIIDDFSYIFNNTFNRSDVVFFLRMLNSTFLDNVNRINPKAWRSLSFHYSVVMVSDFTPKGFRNDLFGTDNLQSASSRNWNRIHQTFQVQSLKFPSS